MTEDEIKNLTIGADPELIFSKNGEMVRADECLFDEEEFGCDGNSSVAELRPKPATTPLGLVEYLGALINWGHTTFPDIAMHAGAMSYGYPIGGHVHFGTYATPTRIKNLDIINESLESLFYDKADIERRREQDYGERLQYRNQAHGIEFRTPVSWLVSPTVALVTLCFLKTGLVNDKIDITNLKENKTDKEFLLSLKDTLEIPEDCQEGFDYLEEAIEEKRDENIILNWFNND